MSLTNLHTVFSFYAYIINHVVPGPNNISYFLPFILLPLALCIPPSILSHQQLYLVFLAAIYALQIHSWLLMHGIDVISINLSLGSFVLLICWDPRKDFRRIHPMINDQLLEKRLNGDPRHIKAPNKEITAAEDSTKERQRDETLLNLDSPSQGSSLPERDSRTSAYWEEPYPSDIRKRVIWVLNLILSWRFPSWLICNPFHDRMQPPTGTTRASFLWFALFSTVEGYLILDLTSLYTRHDPYFRHSHTGISSPPPLPPSGSIPSIIAILWTFLPPRLLRVSILALQLYALIPRLFALPALIPLLLNYLSIVPDSWSPHAWPPFFGPFSAITTRGLRGLWGQWWHQMNRYLHSTPGAWLAERLGLQHGGKARYVALLSSGFGFSGIMHMGLIPPFPLSTEYSAMEMRMYVAGFFWAQIPAILFEVAVAECMKSVSPRWMEGKVARLVTLFWVAAWLSLCLPMVTIPFRELGYWTYAPMPISLVGGITGHGWWTWT